MNTYRLEVDRRYSKLLDDQLAWVQEHFGQRGATKLATAIDAFYDVVVVYPTRFPRLRPKAATAQHLRVAHVEWLRIAYEVYDDDELIVILAVRHERADPRRLIDDVT